MTRLSIVVCFVLLLFVDRASAIEVLATLKQVDLDKGVLVVTANGRDRTVRVAENFRVQDKNGKDVPNDMRSSVVQVGAEVTIVVEIIDGEVTVHEIRLGARPRRGGNPPQMTPARTSVGLKPLTEMTAEDQYQGEEGGLYGDGQNEPPPALAAAAARETEKIVPLDRLGEPSREGKIALISISMSNATQEFSAFKRLADADPDKSPQLTIVDCAQGGQTMAAWSRSDAEAWDVAARRLAAADVSPNQVQVAWIKLANARPTGKLAEHGKQLYDDTVAVLQLAKKKFANLRIVYLGSRIYGGYASTPLNPEPYAYEGAFVVRWLIRNQMEGDAALNFDAEQGPVTAPLLLWGPYLWADGMNPRKLDGLTWKRSDLAGDGTHPSPTGQQKVAELLLKFFKSDAHAASWFSAKAKQ